jgi:hypothetical protein
VEILNLLLATLGIAWFAKIVFHVQYLKATGSNFKDPDIGTFLFDIEYLFAKIMVILPIFIQKKQSSAPSIQIASRVKMALFVWWICFVLFTVLKTYDHASIRE